MSFFAENPRYLSEFQPPPARLRARPTGSLLSPPRPAPRHLSDLSLLSPSRFPRLRSQQTLARKRPPANPDSPRFPGSGGWSCRARIGRAGAAAPYVDRGCSAAAARGWTGSASRTRSRSTSRSRRRRPPGASRPRRGSASLPGSCRRCSARPGSFPMLVRT